MGKGKVKKLLKEYSPELQLSVQSQKLLACFCVQVNAQKRLNIDNQG